MKTVEKELKDAWLVLTYGCNNKCTFCYAQSMIKEYRKDEKDMYMSWEFACQMVTELKSFGVNSFHLIGGEPTLYPHLLDLIKYIKQDPEAKVILVSNGKKLSDEKYLTELIAAGVNSIQISLQGPDADTHNRITGSKSFDLSYAALGNLGKIKFDQFFVTITIGRDNYNQVGKFIQTMKKEIFCNNHKGKIYLGFATPCINSKSPNDINGEYVLTPTEIVECIRDINSRFPKEAYPEIVFANRIPLCLYPKDLWKSLRKSKRIAEGCVCSVHMGNTVAIDPKGDILPCVNFAGTNLFNCQSEEKKFDRTKFIEGINLYYPQIKDLTHSYLVKKCKKCPKFHRCFGSCLFWWLYFKPEDFITNKNI